MTLGQRLGVLEGLDGVERYAHTLQSQRRVAGLGLEQQPVHSLPRGWGPIRRERMSNRRRRARRAEASRPGVAVGERVRPG